MSTHDSTVTDVTGRPTHVPPGRPLLEVNNITLRFGGVTAINDVGFDVMPDELFAIIGPNGAGKTSIFNTISQVYRPQEGDIRFEGESIMGSRPD